MVWARMVVNLKEHEPDLRHCYRSGAVSTGPFFGGDKNNNYSSVVLVVLVVVLGN